jgi:hypothetical protein
MEQVMSSAFEFGLLLHTRSMLGDNDRPPSFDELWEDAAYVEQMNFDQIWLGDSVCILNRARGDCLTTMAALACKTDRIKIGTVSTDCRFAQSRAVGALAGDVGRHLARQAVGGRQRRGEVGVQRT